MRPKKRILLIDTDEQRMGERRFLLNTHGYAAVGAASIAEATEYMAGAFDLILAAWPFRNDDALAELLRQTIAGDTGMPVLVIARKPEDVQRLFAASVSPGLTTLPGLTTTPVELLERVKIMSARKRGPRKGAIYAKPPASVGVDRPVVEVEAAHG